MTDTCKAVINGQKGFQINGPLKGNKSDAWNRASCPYLIYLYGILTYIASKVVYEYPLLSHNYSMYLSINLHTNVYNIYIYGRARA